MRRVIAISLAILVVAIAARGVMAQDVQRDGNDLLLKILKERNILSDREYQEIKGQLASEGNAIDQKLSAIDRSMADYLAKAGDSANGNMSYVTDQGVTFSSGDAFKVYFGGLFQAGYQYGTGDNTDPHGGFSLMENRVDFGGMVFDPNLTFYVQVDGVNSWELMDAYINWKFCPYAQVEIGQFKIPYGREALVDQSDRQFGHMGMVPMYFTGSSDGARDTGMMIHNEWSMDANNPNSMALEWAAGLWNGGGNNATNDTWLAWGVRAGIYPMGAVPYVESDLEATKNVKFGVAGSFYSDERNTGATDNPKDTTWEVDGVLTWNGLFFTGEYFSHKFDNGTTDTTDTGWYVQGSYAIMSQYEVMARYGMVTFDNDDQASEWALGVAYYLEGREWKVVYEIGQQKFDPDVGDSSDDWFMNFGVQVDW